MIAPEEIRAKAGRLWDSGRVLKARLGAEAVFPWSIALARPRGSRLLADFARVSAWKDALERKAATDAGRGYRIEYAEVDHRQLGRQRLPERIVFDTPEDLARFIGKQRALTGFDDLAHNIRSRYPALTAWIARRPLQVLEHGPDWPRLLATLDYFAAHPRPGRYLRELPIPGVDSKFIEGRKRLFDELLDQVLAASAVDREVTGLARHGFERRYGLRHDQPLVRLRLLDRVLWARYGGLGDLSLPLGDFIGLDPPCRRVFITENKINGLSFPTVSDSLVIFGLGYGIDALSEAPWLKRRELFYWGDLDTHGFSILSRLRSYFPDARSFLMDRETLVAGRAAWVREDPTKRCRSDLSGWTAGERAVFLELRDDRHGERVRLEQERIAFPHVEAAVERLVTTGQSS